MSEVQRDYAYWETEYNTFSGISARAAVKKGGAWRKGRAFYPLPNSNYPKLKSVYREKSDTAYFALVNSEHSHLLPDPSRENESIEHELFKHVLSEARNITLSLKIDGNTTTYKVKVYRATEEYKFKVNGNKRSIDTFIRYIDDRDLHWRFGTTLGIEVYKSHRVDKNKKKDLKDANIPTIEIAIPTIFRDRLISSVTDELTLKNEMLEYVASNTIEADVISGPIKSFFKQTSNRFLSLRKEYLAAKSDSEELSSHCEKLQTLINEKSAELLISKERLEVSESDSYRLNNNIKLIKNELTTLQEKYEQTLNENRWYFWSIVILLILIASIVTLQVVR